MGSLFTFYFVPVMTLLCDGIARKRGLAVWADCSFCCPFLKLIFLPALSFLTHSLYNFNGWVVLQLGDFPQLGGFLKLGGFLPA